VNALATAAIAAATSLLVSLLTGFFRLKEIERQFALKKVELENVLLQEQRVEKQRELEKIRLQHLNPLQVAAGDMVGKIRVLRQKLESPEGEEFLRSSFNEVKVRDRNARADFALWCNGIGHLAVSTLYTTCVYFSYAGKIRAELPFIDLGLADDRLLLSHLSRVREAFGGEYNIWETLQDSLGSYVRSANGTVLNYKEFCGKIIDREEYVWFLRLIDFYRDVHLKRNDLVNIEQALESLDGFLNKFRLTTRSDPRGDR
jgi:hypothetical protein